MYKYVIYLPIEIFICLIMFTFKSINLITFQKTIIKFNIVPTYNRKMENTNKNNLLYENNMKFSMKHQALSHYPNFL